MKQVTILGANSLIGQHLICALSSNINITLINLWEENEKFIYRLKSNYYKLNFYDIILDDEFNFLTTNSFIGLDSLEDALLNVDIVSFFFNFNIKINKRNNFFFTKII